MGVLPADGGTSHWHAGPRPLGALGSVLLRLCRSRSHLGGAERCDAPVRTGSSSWVGEEQSFAPSGEDGRARAGRKAKVCVRPSRRVRGHDRCRARPARSCCTEPCRCRSPRFRGPVVRRATGPSGQAGGRGSSRGRRGGATKLSAGCFLRLPARPRPGHFNQLDGGARHWAARHWAARHLGAREPVQGVDEAAQVRVGVTVEREGDAGELGVVELFRGQGAV